MEKENLESQILRARELYESGNPEISDESYDILENKLKELYPDSKVLRGVGSKVKLSVWEKTRHPINMGSLNKVQDLNELGEWLDKINRVLN